MVISLGWLSPATSRGLPAARATRAGSRCLLGLAPTGGYRATPVARRAVGSYPTVSPLPLDKGGLFSVALSVASRRPGVTWQSALWSSDFPRHATPTDMPRPSRPTATRHKATGSGRVGARLARQPPQQAAQAVERHALPEPGCLVRGEPKAVVLLEYQTLQAGPVAGGQRGRRHGHGVREVQATAAVQRQQLARAQLRREQEQ